MQSPLLRAPRRLGVAITMLAALLLAGAAIPPCFAGGALYLKASGFRAEGSIPGRFTCSGANVSPALHWGNAPAGTRSFALIMIDPDAPAHPWVHWVTFDLPPGMTSLPENIPHGDHIRGGGAQGLNDFHFAGYGGPCPPPGPPHRYYFRLYALNIRLGLKPGSTREDVERMMKGHVLAEAELMARYGR